MNLFSNLPGIVLKIIGTTVFLCKRSQMSNISMKKTYTRCSLMVKAGIMYQIKT